MLSEVHLKPSSISSEQLRGKNEAMTELKVELHAAKVSDNKSNKLTNNVYNHEQNHF